MGKFDQPRRFEQKHGREKSGRAILLQRLKERQRQEREKELMPKLGNKLKTKKKPTRATAKKPKVAPKKRQRNKPIIPKRPAIKQKPAMRQTLPPQKYFELSNGIRARILSQAEKKRMGITEAPDTMAATLKRKHRFPSPQKMAEIRQNHEFWDPNNSGVPLVEINEADLDKVILTCGTKEKPVNYTLKEFLRIDPKDIDDAPQGTYFQKKMLDGNIEYYRKITRLSPAIIQKFGRLHKELEDVVSARNIPPFPTKDILVEYPKYIINVVNQFPPKRKSVRLFIDENYRAYGENIYTYFKKPKEERFSIPSYFGRHTSGDALDLQTFILVDGVRIDGREAEGFLRKAITAEWTKHGGGRGFYPKRRNFHMDARNKKGEWGKW